MVRMSVLLRCESSEDSVQIEALIRNAFQTSEHGHHGEAELFVSVSQSEIRRLSLVAEVDEQIVGHALFTEAVLRDSYGELLGMGLAPLAVHPAFQRRGIGTALVREGLSLLWEQGADFVLVLGDPTYYARCGFKPASHAKVEHGFAGIPQEYLLIQFRPGFQREPSERLLAFYSHLFDPQHTQ